MDNILNKSLFGKGLIPIYSRLADLSATQHKVVASNIANVNTEGFSRQEVDITQAPTIPGGRLTFGNGAWAAKVNRVSDQYLEKRIQNEHKNFAGAEEKDLYLHQAEQIFNESNNDGVNRLATRFFNEFRKLSTDPASTAIRATVREASDAALLAVPGVSPKTLAALRKHFAAGGPAVGELANPVDGSAGGEP